MQRQGWELKPTPIPGGTKAETECSLLDLEALGKYYVDISLIKLKNNSHSRFPSGSDAMYEIAQREYSRL